MSSKSFAAEPLFSLLEWIPNRVECLKDWIVWTGFSDEHDEGNFIDSNEGKQINTFVDPIPFQLSQPNGGRDENCVMAYKFYHSAKAPLPYQQSWFDTNCHRRDIPLFCRIENNPRFQIRGNF